MRKKRGRERPTLSKKEISKHEVWLDDLAKEINEYHHKAVKALRAGVLYALHAGDKLSLAQGVLDEVRAAREKCRWAPAPTWEEWVNRNCEFKDRTAYDYKRLHANRDLIEPYLDDPDVSVRKLIRVIAKGTAHLGSDDGGNGDGRPSPEGGPGRGRGKPLPYDRALREVIRHLRRALKECQPEEVVVFLADHPDDVCKFVKAICAEVEPLVPVWQKACKSMEEAGRQARTEKPEREPLPASGKRRKHAERTERVADMRRSMIDGEEAFGLAVWREVRDRLDDLTAYQKGWVVGQLGEVRLGGRDRRMLQALVDEVEGTEEDYDPRDDANAWEIYDPACN